MGLVYLFSLVVGLGVLVVQIAMGGKGGAGGGDAGDADGGDGDAGDADADAGEGGGKPLSQELAHAHAGAGDTLSFFLSLRFWIFALLGFGMSGSLLHVFALAGPIVVFLLAFGSGIVSGSFAALAFRFIARSSTSSTADVTRAAGTVGRVLVPVGKNKVGKIRIVLKGQSVDVLATSDGEELARGEHVLVEDVEGEIARVSKSPSELT